IVQVNAVIALIEEADASTAGKAPPTAPASGAGSAGKQVGSAHAPGGAGPSGGGASGAGASGGGASAAETVDDGDKLSLFKPSAGGDTEALPRMQRPADRSSGTRLGREPARGAFGRVLAVPAARKLARELGVSIEEVLGSG